MPAENGLPPWATGYKKVRLGNKKQFKALNANFEKRPLNTVLTGDKYYLPKQDHAELTTFYNRYKDELTEGYYRGKKLKRKVSSMADLIDYAFEAKSQEKQLTTAECQGGHIKRITYNALYTLLMVEFTKRGDICVFFNLPASVAAYLMHLAETNQMGISSRDGTERHQVGIEFWNLVRVRGTVHSTQYPFQYTKDFCTGGRFGRRTGFGPNGDPSKWVYLSNEEASELDIDISDKRSKNDDARVRSSPIKLNRLEYEERKRKASAQATGKLTLSTEQIDNFFNNGAFDDLLIIRRDYPKDIANLERAFEAWDNDEGNDAIIKALQDAEIDNETLEDWDI